MDLPVHQLSLPVVILTALPRREKQRKRFISRWWTLPPSPPVCDNLIGELPSFSVCLSQVSTRKKLSKAAF